MKSLMLILGASSVMLAYAAGAREIYVNVDFCDEVRWNWARTGRGYAPQDVTNLLRRCRMAGATGINLRSAPLGIVFHPSERAWRIDEAVSKGVNSISVAERRTDDNAIGHLAEKTIASFSATMETLPDAVAEFATVSKSEGLKFNIWMDIHDEMFGKFTTEHPECLVKTAAGKTFPALRDYGNEVAVADKLAELAEYFKYHPDGFYFCPSCHTRHMKIDEPDNAFGTLPAAKFTDFLRRAKSAFRPHGFTLTVGTACGGSLNFCSPHFSGHVKYRIEHDWKTWIDEKIVDGLVVADYERLHVYDGIWRSKGIVPDATLRHPIDYCLREFPAYTKRRVPLYYFSTWLTKDTMEDVLSQGTYDVLAYGLDGIFIHEAMMIEGLPGGFEAIASMRKIFDTAR